MHPPLLSSSLGNALSPLLSTSSSQLVPRPKTTDELRKWIEEYCKGVKYRGEPNTWDVTLVTNMSMLFAKIDLDVVATFNAPIDQWITSQVTNMKGMFEVRSTHALRPTLSFSAHRPPSFS